MGKVIIQSETTKKPISLIGKEAGVCWNSKDNPKANYTRGMDCICAGHGRTLEFPQVYMVLDGYSARVIREFYTHIGGSPTRLQESTRYVNESDFKYVTPNFANEQASKVYELTFDFIQKAYGRLLELGEKKEDAAMLLPLGMQTKVVVRTNLRNLSEMAHQRLCSRAYWEYRQLMNDTKNALAAYSDEWKFLADNLFVEKCTYYGFCTEKKPCKISMRGE